MSDSNALRDFVTRHDPATAWTVRRRSGRSLDVALTSQSWKGSVWHHSLEACGLRPDTECALLVITGWDPNPLDRADQKLLAKLSGLPCATLYDIPNQPLFDRIEDDLIAFTFAQFLETDDSEWPLVFPMVKSVRAAMDALCDLSEGALSKFVLTGGSKRGWTAWLAAATADQRIIGIAPQVYDNLNIRLQLGRQLERWGSLSSMLDDYSAYDLPAHLDSPKGESLIEMVDPYAYRSGLTLPKLMINGANDPYWMADALGQVWADLPDPKNACIVPNAGHGLGDKMWMTTGVAAFAAACAKGESLPHFSWNATGSKLQIQFNDQLPNQVRLWLAESETLDFSDSLWAAVQQCGFGKQEDVISFTMSIDLPSSRLNRAVFAECRYPRAGMDLHLTSTIHVFPSNAGR